MLTKHRRWMGFAVVETLIITLILGILAMVVVPRFSEAAHQPKEARLKRVLHELRTKIMVYRAEHDGRTPGSAGGRRVVEPDDKTFVAQMTMRSDAVGDVSPSRSAAHPLGPYIWKMPQNPINHSAKVRMIGINENFPSKPEGDEGWVYQPSTGLFAANIEGTDSRGTHYFDY